MIRHTPSFFISLIVHLLLLVAFFFTYTYVRSLPSSLDDEIICIQLQCVAHEKRTPPIKKPKSPEPIKSKPVKPTIEKPKVVKPKEVKTLKKAPEKTLSVPVIQENVKPLEKPKETLVFEVPQEESSQEEKAIAQQKVYMDENIKKIVQLLSENLYYPRSARKRGVVGEVVVKFSLGVDAHVHSIEVVSSQSEILSRAAIKTIKELSGKFPRPSEEFILQVPIKYELKR